ncbi:hypothetical protein MNBD_BACTEROID05-1112 [hydrothermal vent metagenome]|uniref:HMA domain-containing protein n=1 Tax=hydrothermal vent metagenome TaxID=652676 RepID=A0A3B0SYK8_9ZZZZ
MIKLNKNVSMVTAVFTAVSLKLCCWGPSVLIGLAGISGGSTYFSWLDTIKPYLLILAFISLTYGFYQVYKPRNEETCDSCNSNNKSIFRSKIYIWLVALFVVTMTLVSYYPQLFYQSIDKNLLVIEQSSIEKVSLIIKGMTCTGCEENINHSISKLDGVLEVKSSFENGISKIEFDKSKTSLAAIEKIIRSKGYILN